MSRAKIFLSSTQCTHSQLQLLPSSDADEVGYHRPSIEERKFTCLQPKDLKDGSRPTRRERKNWSKENVADMTAFPSPLLVLPGGDIALDVDYPHQSFDSWLREEDRNEITSRKKVVYVAASPILSLMFHLLINGKRREPSVIHQFQLQSWESCGTRRGPKTKSKREEPQYIGFNIGTECVPIRTRVSLDGIFPRYETRLYESADDTFVCGRAYGGSRVAVVSTSRYNPILDGKHNVDREHSWPASHCKDYVVKSSCIDISNPKRRTKLSSSSNQDITSNDDALPPLPAALLAHKSLPPLDLLPTTTQLAGLCFSRVCRTANHALGHCFGIDHCMYYACSMQGSASLPEDARQPPYLCPIDLAKMLHAAGTTAKDRYLALLSFCKKHDEIHLFAASAAWIASRLDRI
ncbi:hypothetical protein ACJ73_03713 [Blastomyces percursus]|uniref:Uncharacterized protein n=1 Tax=Blastomyces percursus TaxID=1658174 RepID=A0A1J9Q8R0_9EURO|nr:hypothetical protein ACJ73_03713 [Blastomyces percursus]